MAIRKQEFYEGAALHLLVRGGGIQSLTYSPPFFTANFKTALLLKYSTKNRSPWSFTFTASEQHLLGQCQPDDTVLALICASDGVAAIRYKDYLRIAPHAAAAIHIACQRRHGEHYEVSGPEGTLPRKISPSAWSRVLNS